MCESLDKVDWALLHQQKLVLLAIRSRQCDGSAEFEALSGIIHLLDALQDDAVAAGRWQFPNEEADHEPKNDWRKTAPSILYEAYPDHDLLPIEPPKPGETISDFEVRARDAADTLFLFLCREAEDEIDADEYVGRLDRAIRDIEAVREAFCNPLDICSQDPKGGEMS